MGTDELIVLILAGGKGTRMKSDLAKVLHPVGGRPMLEYVLDTSRALEPGRIIVIVGHQAERVESLVGDRAECVLQEPQLGTGHAVMCAADRFNQSQGTLVLLYGDVPLITPRTVRGLLEHHRSGGHSATVLSTVLQDASGYGRIIRKENGDLDRIVEEKDACAGEKEIREINTGIYCFNIPDLVPLLDELSNDNAQGEYYITDAAEILNGKGKSVGVMAAADPGEVEGVNNAGQLARVEQVLSSR